MNSNMDGSVYPDIGAIPTLSTPAEKTDYVMRVCAAWDYGIVPDLATFRLFAGWSDIFTRFPVRDSPAYHAFCEYFGWPHTHGRIFRARYEILDQLEGRDDDYEGWA